jgi:hypothetical protein
MLIDLEPPLFLTADWQAGLPVIWSAAQRGRTMKYDVLTLDTQVFYGNGFDLEAGYLGQLKQFKTGPTRVILSSVVAREVRKQLAEKIRETRDDFESAMRRAHKYGLRSPADGAVKLIDGAPRELARQRVKDYIEAVGATLVPVGLVSVDDVMKRYFAPAPPFSASGKKKAEFPDAVALMTLEAWAQKNGKTVLAVSKDSDWAAFASESKRLTVVESLEQALAQLQEHADEARAIVRDLLDAVARPETDAFRAFEEKLELEVEAEEFVVPEVDHAHYHAAVESYVMGLRAFELAGRAPEFKFKVIQAGPYVVAASIELRLTVRVEASVAFSVGDGLEQTRIGGRRIVEVTEVDAMAIASWSKDILDGWNLVSLDLVHTSDPDLGEIEFEPDTDEWSDIA